MRAVIGVGLVVATSSVRAQWYVDPPKVGERLSAWLLREAGPLADTTALQWRVEAQKTPQRELRDAVVSSLETSANIRMPMDQRLALAEWLRGLPLTGRLPLQAVDTRWLEGAATADPILDERQQAVLPPRPRQVAVVATDGRRCLVAHQPGARAMHYLQACADVLDPLAVDRVWLVQVDGRVSNHGVAPWSLEAQPEPSPGAWIWAPSREAAVPQAVSDNLARFLATQLPAEFAVVGADAAPVRRHVVESSSHDSAPRDSAAVSNDWGEIGYLQTPSARFAGAGASRVHYSNVWPNSRLSFRLEPVDGFEFGFRYTSISNRAYSASTTGQSNKDKSLDVKVRLRREDAYGPEVALGIRDVGGTGLFSGEYLVASKRWGDWDASLGLGWGNIGARGNIRNPLSALLGNGFDQRGRNTTVTGGTLNLTSMFHGPAALFAGLQWQAPAERWVFKVELDGNDYQHEPSNNNLPTSSPLNVGLTYRYSRNVDLHVGLERGNRLAFGLNMHPNLKELNTLKLADPVLPPVTGLMPPSMPSGGVESVAGAIGRYTGWEVTRVQQQHGTLVAEADVDDALYLQERIDRATGVLHNLIPGDVRRFELHLSRRGLPLTRVDVDRAEWVAQRVGPMAPALRLTPSIDYGVEVDSAKTADGIKAPPPFSWQWAPSYGQIFGGPDSFVLYNAGVQASMEYRLGEGTWISGQANLRLLDNYSKFQYNPPPAPLPRVRTYQREFATTSRFTIPNLQFTHVRHLGGDHFGSVYAGLLESMYGGFGAEWLYRPWRGSWAFGVDVNHVRQRDFGQDFSFRDYSVNTGHATWYWDTGWNDVHVKLSAGRYLAGDVGATLDVKRTFRNGIAIGAWATKTNVSAAQFGEGSFDKGIYVSIPFDTLLPFSSGESASLRWAPLTRDGGAQLQRSFPLFNLTQHRDGRSLKWQSAGATAKASGDNLSYVLREPRYSPLSEVGATADTLFGQVADIPGSTWLWAAGAVLASSALDRRVDRFAQQHQGGSWDTFGSITSFAPYALAAGAGLAYSGLLGEDAASTGETALMAGAYTLAANLALRTVVGRSRPYEGQGPGTFHGLSSAAMKSGFPSNHTAVAFALVTPFAQQYGMPWLYGVAAASALGRIQKREHWFSDTVAGALLGYGVGSMLTQQQNTSDRGPRLSVTPSSISASWSF